MTCETQVRQDLRLVYSEEPVDRLYLDHQRSFDEQVQTISRSQLHAFVADWNVDFGLEANAR